MEQGIAADEDLILELDKGRLSLLDDDADFIVCRRCRSLSSSSCHAQCPQRWLGPDTVVGSGVINGRLPPPDRNVWVSRTSVGRTFHEEEMGEVVDDSFGDQWSHCHSQASLNDPVSRKTAIKRLIIVCIFCSLFMCIEAIGGYFANSLAIATDAAHLFADLFGFLISLVAICLGKRKATQKLSFGYARSEVIGALFSILFIWVLAAGLVYMAVNRIIKESYKDVDPNIMLIVSCLGIAFNVIMGLILHPICCRRKSGHGEYDALHNHGHSHGFNSHGGKDEENINVRSAMIHVIGDLLQSIGVAVAAVVIKLVPGSELADPICTFLFTAIMMCTTVPIIRDVVNLLMEGVPKSMDSVALKEELRMLPGVVGLHDFHTWSLTMDQHSVTAHLVIETMAENDSVLRSALKLVQGKYKVQRCTFQVEKYSEVMDACSHCQLLESARVDTA